MPSNSLSRSSSKSSLPRYTHALELLTVLEPPPEPTTTASGVVPGTALYDSPPPNLEASEAEQLALSQRPQRVKTPTEKGTIWIDAIKQSQDRSAKIHRTKERKSIQSSKYSASSLNGDDTDGGYSTNTTENQPVKQMQQVQITNPLFRTSSACGAANAAGGTPSAGAHDRGSGASQAGRTRTHARSGSPTPIPGTPGEDPEFLHSFDATARATTESEYTYILESVDPTVITLALERHLEYDCSNIDPETSKAMLAAILQDRQAPVGPPKQQTQVIMLSPSPINVGGGNHRDRVQISGSGTSRSAKRSLPHSKKKGPKRQKVTIKNKHTDTESESPISSTTTDSEPATEPETQEISNPAELSRSPSPLPHSHFPTDPYAPGWIDLRTGDPSRPRESLGTTQPSTQYTQASQTSQSSTPATKATSAQQPHPRSGSSSSSYIHPRSRPRGLTLISPTKARSSQPSLHVASQPPASNLHSSSEKLPSLQRAPPPGFDLASLRRSAKHKVQARRSRSQLHAENHTQDAAPARARAPHAKALRQEQSLLLRNLSKEVRVAREVHRRQEVAAASGLNLEDIAPAWPEQENLADALLVDDEEQRAAAVAEEAGELPVIRKHKPSARDLHGYERQVVSPAKMLLLAHTLKEGPFQTRGTFTDWAGDIWLDAWRQELPHVTPRAATEAIKQILVNALATGRGRFKEPVRPLVQYKLGFIKPALTAEDINHNLKLFGKIHPNTFHCTRYSPPYGHYESDIVTHAIAVTLFGSANAIGVEHREMFNPMPLTTAAFMLSIVQFCMEEYETGQFRARDLNMADMLNKYVAHLRGLKEARAAAKGRITRLQQHWFDFGFEYSGATPPDEPYHQPITLRSDVRPDTPQPGSDDSNATEIEPIQSEPEVEDEHIVMGKGKDRAT